METSYGSNHGDDSYKFGEKYPLLGKSVNTGQTSRRRMSSSHCLLHSSLIASDISQNYESIKENDSQTNYSPPEVESNGSAIIGKEDLSSMVLNVRQMSRSLSNLRLKFRLDSIIIVSSHADPSIQNKELELCTLILDFPGTQDVKIFVEEMNDKKLPVSKKHKSNIRYWNEQMCATNPEQFDLVVTLGGDGTVLRASMLFQTIVPPVLSFNFGSLGFLTNYNFANAPSIFSNMLQNGLSSSLRMRFDCTVFRARHRKDKHMEDLGKEIKESIKSLEYIHHIEDETFCILNDVVVDRGPEPTMTITELYGDRKLITACQGDGVVIATPTGSTAYSLSANGSLVSPDMSAILITPMCPHTLSFRPLIVPDSVTVRVGVPYDARSSVWCSFDGTKRVRLERGDFLTIAASPFAFPKVLCEEDDWFSSLRHTLQWNVRRRQKSTSAK